MLLQVSQAAVFSIAAEAEQGAINGNAKTVSIPQGQTVSGLGSVLFGANTAASGGSAAEAGGWGSPVAGTEDWAGISNGNPDWSVVDGVTDQWGTKSRQQVAVADGVMTITGSKTGGIGGAVAYFGGPNSETGGRWEVRMRVPSGDWTWKPVLLLWPYSENWPEDGEVDYYEAGAGTESGSSPVDVGFNLHYGVNDSQISSKKEVDIRDWHTYAVEWTSTAMRGYIDGVKFFETTNKAALPPGPMWHSIQLDWNLDGEDSLITATKWELDWLRVYDL